MMDIWEKIEHYAALGKAVSDMLRGCDFVKVYFDDEGNMKIEAYDGNLSEAL